jgi:NAD(P)-dependent dehydrogenase (short-subunit alcohol dehydrogenase family)
MSEMSDISGKTAIVTDAASGLGLSIAENSSSSVANRRQC